MDQTNVLKQILEDCIQLAHTLNKKADMANAELLSFENKMKSVGVNATVGVGQHTSMWRTLAWRDGTIYIDGRQWGQCKRIVRINAVKYLEQLAHAILDALRLEEDEIER